MRQPLQEKYRPTTFDDFVGNKDTVTALKTLVGRKEGKTNAILLMGPRGCGKTTLAKIVKNAYGVSDSDFVEMNTANVRGIDTIRDVVTKAQFLPLQGSKKIFFFDECHKLTNDAQNAMLKLLENPPDHVVFILATTDPEKLLATVLSRCTKFVVSLLGRKEIIGLLKDILDAEKITDYPSDAVSQIADVCEGSPREALILLDATVDILDETALFNTIRKHVIDEKTVKEFCIALLDGKPWKEIVDLMTALPGFTDDQEKIRYAVAGYLAGALRKNDGKKADRIAFMLGEFVNTTFMYSKQAGLTMAAYNAALAGK